MTPKHYVLAKKEILDLAVRVDGQREISPQYSPSLSTFSPGFGFLHLHTIHSQQKWSVEIGPQCFSIEVRPLERVPGRIHLVTGKTIFRRIALRNHGALEFLDRDLLRSKHGALI